MIEILLMSITYLQSNTSTQNMVPNISNINNTSDNCNYRIKRNCSLGNACKIVAYQCAVTAREMKNRFDE